MVNDCCFYNGSYLPYNEVTFPANDIGIQRGYGLFDYFRIRNGKAFLLIHHLRRLESSLQGLRIILPYKLSELESIVQRLISDNNIKDGAMRILVSGGKTEQQGIYTKPNFAILAEDFIPYPEINYTRGAYLIAKEYMRFLPKYKSINYLPSFYYHRELHENEAIDILFHFKGILYETSRSNIFLVKDNTLITPEKDVLPGITRKLVLELSKGVIKTECREVRFEELKKAEEVFITGTSKEIMPVIRIGKRIIGNDTIGKTTHMFMEKFRGFALESNEIPLVNK